MIEITFNLSDFKRLFCLIADKKSTAYFAVKDEYPNTSWEQFKIVYQQAKN
jgi:hypothetical protein